MYRKRNGQRGIAVLLEEWCGKLKGETVIMLHTVKD